MKFNDDRPIRCHRCDKWIVAGESYLVYEKRPYCCEEHVMKQMYDDFMERVEEAYLETADDKAGNYADMLRDE